MEKVRRIFMIPRVLFILHLHFQCFLKLHAIIIKSAAGFSVSFLLSRKCLTVLLNISNLRFQYNQHFQLFTRLWNENLVSLFTIVNFFPSELKFKLILRSRKFLVFFTKIWQKKPHDYLNLRFFSLSQKPSNPALKLRFVLG